MEPVCGVAAVSTAYAAGPASVATSAAAPTARAIRRGRNVTPASSSAETSPATSTRYFTQGRKSGLRSRSAKPSTAVRETVPDAMPMASSESRRSHSSQAPVPTSAAIAGASATV